MTVWGFEMLIPWAHQQAAAIILADPAGVLIARMSPAPDAAREILIRALVTSLIADGVWARLDCLYVTAAAASQPARLNWISPNYDLTAVNTPTFTVDRGYTGDGASSYLTSSYAPFSGGTKYVQDSACMGVWIGTEQTGSTLRDIAISARGNLNSRNSTVMAGSINTSTAPTVTLPANTSIGFSGWSRESSVLTRFYKTGIQRGADNATASIALVSGTAVMLAATAASGFTTRRTQAGYFGASLTATQELAFYNAMQTYMTAIGA